MGVEGFPRALLSGLGNVPRGLDLTEPDDVARRRAVREAPAEQPQGVVVVSKPELAHHHRFLEELPLSVAAAHALDLAVDRADAGQRLCVIPCLVSYDA